MPLYYITGISGSGKSTVYDELKRRGLMVFGVDEDKLAGWYNSTTGSAEGYREPKDRTKEWRSQVTYKLPRQHVEEIAVTAKNKSVFLCGVSENDIELYDLFSKVFALSVDEATLRERITKRTNNDFGKLPHELEGILKWNKNYLYEYKKLGATIIDSSQPIDKVVDDILVKTLV